MTTVADLFFAPAVHTRKPAYYNEFDPYAAQWIRNLIAAGHIAPGEVDERSIADVRPSDLGGFVQCHFFAGIGVWSHALRRAGWADDRPVWTGSCPCQPFSAAGKGAGFADDRHLWPVWQPLIAECRPAIVLGEQVASKDADPWIDLVCTDMEALGYAFGAVPFPAAGVGAPHIRDRLYWCGVGLADSGSQGLPQRECERRVQREALFSFARETIVGSRAFGGVGNAELSAQERQQQHGRQVVSEQEAEGLGLPSFTNGFWRHADWIACADGRSRPVEPGTFPLAHGAAARVGRLRAYGNAICAEAAQAFIESVMECQP